MIDKNQLATMLTTNQSRTFHVLLTRRHVEQNELTKLAYDRYRDDDRFRNGVAQSVGSILKIVEQCYHSERGLDQKELGSLLTSQQGVQIHAMTAGDVGRDHEATVVEIAAERYRDEPAFRELIAQSVGALMSIVMHCDSKENLVEVPKEILDDDS